MWTDPEQVRKELGLKVVDVSDEELNYYINKAQENLLHDIAVYRFEEPMIGTINGTNTTFQTLNYPIADANFDKVVNADDIEVYKWGDIENISTRQTVPVSLMYPKFGIVILRDPPESTIEVVTCTYYYLPMDIDFNRIGRATALLAAYYYIRTEMLLIPESWAHGAYRFQKGTPAEELLNEYYRELERLKGKMHIKREHEDIEFLRDKYERGF